MYTKNNSYHKIELMDFFYILTNESINFSTINYSTHLIIVFRRLVVVKVSFHIDEEIVVFKNIVRFSLIPIHPSIRVGN
jgi:hypothetical protein